jgi:hypothetical protein
VPVRGWEQAPMRCRRQDNKADRPRKMHGPRIGLPALQVNYHPPSGEPKLDEFQVAAAARHLATVYTSRVYSECCHHQRLPSATYNNSLPINDVLHTLIFKLRLCHLTLFINFIIVTPTSLSPNLSVSNKIKSLWTGSTNSSHFSSFP